MQKVIAELRRGYALKFWVFRSGRTRATKGSDIICRGSFEHPLELVAQHPLLQVFGYPINNS
jgi:hypothetical protein